MSHTIGTITLGLFLLPCFLTGSDCGPSIKAAAPLQPSEIQKKQWAEDAAKYERIVAALGGKMLKTDEEKDTSKVTSRPQTKTDIRARL